MNETPMLDQLRIYSEALVDDLPNTATDFSTAPEPFAPRPPERHRGWAVAVAAAALTLIVVGGVAWLLSNGDSAPPASGAVPPPGEGPQLSFVRSESPSGGWVDDAVWFRGALYALSSGELFRSSNGMNWEPVPGPPDAASLPRSQGLETGGGLLLYVEGENEGGSLCALPGDAIVVHSSADGADWKTSRINLPIPDWPTDYGCYSYSVGVRDGLAVGPEGIMITAVVGGEIVAESIFEPEFDLGFDPETVEDAIRGGAGVFTAADGQVYGLDLDAAGNHSWFTSRGYAWFSPDGQTWNQLDASGPLDGGEIAAVVATSGGFVATSTNYGLWETTDGTTWLHKSGLAESHLSDPSGLDVWAGQLVAATTRGVWTINDTPQELIASSGTSGLSVMQTGELGLIAIASENDGGGTEVLFSKDGTTWNRWTPTEIGPGIRGIYVVGIGDEFVVLQTGGSVWVGRLP
jgi:hypothetical protein